MGHAQDDMCEGCNIFQKEQFNLVLNIDESMLLSNLFTLADSIVKGKQGAAHVCMLMIHTLPDAEKTMSTLEPKMKALMEANKDKIIEFIAST